MGIADDIYHARCDERIALWNELWRRAQSVAEQERAAAFVHAITREKNATKVWAPNDEVVYDSPRHAYHGRRGWVKSVIPMGGGPWDWVEVKEYGTNETFGAPMWELKEDDQ